MNSDDGAHRMNSSSYFRDKCACNETEIVVNGGHGKRMRYAVIEFITERSGETPGRYGERGLLLRCS